MSCVFFSVNIIDDVIIFLAVSHVLRELRGFPHYLI